MKKWCVIQACYSDQSLVSELNKLEREGWVIFNILNHGTTILSEKDADGKIMPNLSVVAWRLDDSTLL